MHQQDKAAKLSKEMQILLGNYCLMSSDARDSLTLLADGFAKNSPHQQPGAIRLVPKSWRPSVLRFLLFR